MLQIIRVVMSQCSAVAAEKAVGYFAGWTTVAEVAGGSTVLVVVAVANEAADDLGTKLKDVTKTEGAALNTVCRGANKKLLKVTTLLLVVVTTKYSKSTVRETRKS